MTCYAARVKLSPFLSGLLRSQLERAIDEAVLTHDDEIVARMYLIEQCAQMDIAEELHWNRITIHRRMPRILEEIERTAKILFCNATKM